MHTGGTFPARPTSERVSMQVGFFYGQKMLILKSQDEIRIEECDVDYILIEQTDGVGESQRILVLKKNILEFIEAIKSVTQNAA